jgi:hypothetical protein
MEKKWKSVQETVIVQRDHLTVDLPPVLLQEDHRAAVHHRIAQALAVHLLHHVHNLAKIAQLAVVAMTALAQLVKSLKAVKSAIHAGFDLHLKSATSLELDLVSLNRISLKMLLTKSSRRAFALNF